MLYNALQCFAKARLCKLERKLEHPSRQDKYLPNSSFLFSYCRSLTLYYTDKMTEATHFTEVIKGLFMGG
jgi:hypothetical protein